MSTEIDSFGDIDVLQFFGGNNLGIMLQLKTRDGSINVNPEEAFRLARALLNWVDDVTIEEERRW